MHKLKRYNWETREDDDYQVMDKWRIGGYDPRATEWLNCAGCGEVIPHGEQWPSMEIHTPLGYLFAVCRECADAEVRRKAEAEGAWPKEVDA